MPRPPPGVPLFHFHLPLTPQRIQQMGNAPPHVLRAFTAFLTHAASGVGFGSPTPQAWRHDAPTPDFKTRWDRASAHFLALPLEVFHDRASLEGMPLRELKALATERRVPLTGLLDKADIVARLLERGGSSSEGCPICAEEYVAGEDVLRVLPCSHRFHCDCADRWFLNPVREGRERSLFQNLGREQSWGGA